MYQSFKQEGTKMRPVPYIGVTGVTTVVEANRILQSRPQYAKHNLMVGVLVSNRTLDPTFSRAPKRYAPLRMIPEIFQNHTGALNILHFYTDKKSTQHILDDLVCADSIGGPNCHGVQLNLPWPSVELVQLYKKSTNGKVVILQCGSQALEDVESNGAALVERLRPYQGLVDHVLIDPSGGRGKEFDVELARDCFACLAQIPNMGFGVAGGLNETNLERLIPLIEEFGPFNIDAEGGLRNGSDQLRLSAAGEYVRIANQLFKQHAAAA